MKIILSLFLIVCNSALLAQTNDYCIYLMSGDIKVGTKGKSPEKAKVNQFLSNNQELLIAEKAQVTLVTKDARYLTLNTAGTYKVSDMASNLKNYPPGVTQKYVSLLWKDLVAAQDNFSTARKSAAAGTIGGVHRGDECGTLIFPSVNMRTSSEQIRFIWKSIPSVNQYELQIMDGQMNDIFSKQLSDTQINLSLSKEMAGKTGEMYWTVKVKSGSSCDIEAKPFQIFKREEEDKILGPDKEISETADPIGQLQAIDQLEKDGWIYRAFHRYELLLKANPGNRMLTGQYAMLLMQYGFLKEAEEIYSRK